jgi:phospholipid transport system substrate-binding protein
MQPGDTDVTVRSEVKQPGGEPIAIQYNMEKVDGSWKVYDLSVAGVSLVTTYRETFNTEVRSGGVEGLIKTLKTKNQQLAAKNG